MLNRISPFNAHPATFHGEILLKKWIILYANMCMQNENEAVSHIFPLMKKSEVPSTARSRLSNERKNFENRSVVLNLGSFLYFQNFVFFIGFSSKSLVSQQVPVHGEEP